MKPNYQLVKDLMKCLVQLSKLSDRLDNANIQIETVGKVSDDLYTAILDAIGFPDYKFEFEHPACGKCVCHRTKWDTDVFCLTEIEGIDEVLDKLHTEYTQLLIEKPDLFTEKVEQN